MSYLLDTNVVSEIRKSRPDAGVLAWWDSVRSADLYLSVMTIGEIRRGAESLRRKDPDQAGQIERWLAGLLSGYGDRIVGVDIPTTQEWGRINVPDPMPVVDGLLAATARVRNWTLVTRNTADFSGRGVRTLNPFQSGNLFEP